MSSSLLRNSALSLFALLLGVGFAFDARALTIDCATADCIGGVYTLEVEQTGVNQYVATYTIDTTGAFDVAATSLVDINLKVANAYSDISILSGPSGSVLAGPLTGSGCSGNNGGFLCVDLTPNVSVGSTYTWRLQFDADSLIGEDEWHIGARYTSATQQRGWVISETSRPIPEPSAALVFGAGLLVASGWMKRGRAIE